ncbi:Endonuclease/exonuclease/phosphatase [Phascolomyces articulosus]|uniref:Endonuclease/exonuclease/phosphatase n=1 Tax=Phascolomyces articulosus TaxID=60185 RepID=A0AAD5JW59_9FUNG|nr:Endonuclease/exonuclease/phosphatase [Phascolomyces articulosus]
MGKDTTDIEKLKQEKKAKKLEKKRLSQNKQQTIQQQAQQPQPKPFQRSFHAIPNRKRLSKPSLGTFSIMSFNLLGQCLVKRKLFPDSGDMLKWKARRNMVSAELEMYNPDIMCLQEVDNYNEYYKPILEKLGYKAEYTKHIKKLHGLLIAYNPKIFKMIKYDTVDYDEASIGAKTWITSNIGQVMALKHIDHPEFGIVIGNTHLYWRPTATYERLRQSTIFINTIVNIQKSLQETELETQWAPIPTGDFNTTPDDPGYIAVTTTEMTSEEEAQLEESRTNPGSFMTKTSTTEDGEAKAEDKAPAPEQDEGEKVDQEEGVTKDTMPTSELVSLIKQGAPEAWHSIYSCHGEIDPKVSIPCIGEPKFTNYTAAFKGTLDYMFLRNNETSLVATEVLSMPPEETVLPSLPNRNFGSDHMCLISKFEFAV